MYFSVSYDQTTKIISAVVCALMIGIAVVVPNLWIGALCVLLLAIPYGYSPRGYVVEGRSITVKRLLRDLRLPLENLREARIATPLDLSGCIRLWGSGGAFGYYGLFSTSKLGRCTWYVTNRRQSVVVVTGTKTWLFSPDDVEGFLRAVAAPASPAPSGVPAFESSGRGLGRLALIPVAVIAFVIGGLYYSPGLPGYTLTRDQLTIHDKFYPVTLEARDVDAEGIRIVDAANDPEWRPVERTNGFGNLRYASGWFRSAGGKEMRMYRVKGGRRLVLFPPKGSGAAVLYQAREPERFVEEVKGLWLRP